MYIVQMYKLFQLLEERGKKIKPGQWIKKGIIPLHFTSDTQQIMWGQLLVLFTLGPLVCVAVFDLLEAIDIIWGTSGKCALIS